MRRFAVLLFAGVPTLVAAQGFGVYEQNTCAMGRAGVTAAGPCADGSAIFFNPAGLAGLAGTRFAAGVTLIGARGSFTDDFIAEKTELDNPSFIPVPSAFLTHVLSPKVSVGIGAYAPYGLETRWPEGFEGRFIGYKTNIRSVYIQPTIAYELSPRLKMGIGIAYITSHLELHQRADLSTQVVPSASVPPGTRFAALGIPTGSDFADAALNASGSGFAVNFGAILKLSDRFTIGGHWLTRRTIKYDGDANFDPVPTGLILPRGHQIQLPPLCDTTGPCDVDNLVAPFFQTGFPLADGAVKTSITLPPQGSIGFAYTMTDTWTVMADYQLVVWGWFSTVVIDFENAGTPDITLTPRNKDTHGFRFGTEYQYSPKLLLRGGYLHHTGASPANFVTPLLPEAARNEFTVGAGVTLKPKWHADVAYQYIKQDDRRGTVNLALGNTGLYKFSGHLIGLGMAYTF